MLDRKEELRLAAALSTIRHDTKLGTGSYEGLSLTGQLWLAEKCKELNDENKSLLDQIKFLGNTKK